MNNKKFSCSVEEWIFARYFTRLRIDLNNSMFSKENLFRFLSISLVPFVIGMFLNLYLKDEISFLAYAFLILFSFSGIFYSIYLIIHNNIFIHDEIKKIDIEPSENQTIDFVFVQKDGLLINVFNNDTTDNMLFVPWTDIYKAKIDFTELPILYLSENTHQAVGILDKVDHANSDPVTYFENIKNKFSLFNEELPQGIIGSKISKNNYWRTKFDNRFSLFLHHPIPGDDHSNETISNHTTQIQIPPSWFSNGNLETLLLSIEDNTNISIQR